MKKIIVPIGLSLLSLTGFSQVGHVMQGVGAFNMSMGGAATGQALDISGALQWNPASISAFDETSVKLDLGLFFASPELGSSLPANFMWPGSPAVSGITKDEKGVSLMPALAMVWGKKDSKHTFGASVFGVSGFGVVFPEEKNAPMDAAGNPNPNFNPSNPSSPINYPQAAGGFGRVESDYMLLQIGLTYSYSITDKFSVGIEPTLNYGSLRLMPNPTANPNLSGYPTTESTGSIGFGGQFGLYFDSGSGFKAGASYKTEQYMGEMNFSNTYPDKSTGNNLFTMNYPAMLSLGVGYSNDKFDVALDYRNVDYKNCDGFSTSGWTKTGSVAGFGWDNMTVISVGLQYKGFEKLPIRLGYTYNSNPIPSELAFYSVSAPAVITNAFQLGLSYKLNDKIRIDGVYHYGTSGDGVEGQMLSPKAVTPQNPLGKLPGTSVSYKMNTSLIMLGLSYKLN